MRRKTKQKPQGNLFAISFSSGRRRDEKYICRFSVIFIHVVLLATLSRAVERIKGGKNEKKRSGHCDLARKMSQKRRMQDILKLAMQIALLRLQN